jgi:prepilin-type N-terminal cleavage/methylation domain-containing protein
MTTRQRRTGFTLIELLVVITIIGVLASLTLAFLPGVFAQARESSGASQLQGWLNISRQRALRDQAPRGLRLWLGKNVATQVTDCQYIEQPDDYATGFAWTSGDGQVDVNFVGTSLLNGYSNAPANQPFWNVQPGDYLEVLGTGLMHKITSISSDATLTVATPITYQLPNAKPNNNVSNYRILRTPRTSGEETLTLPSSIVVDVQTNLVTFAGLPGSALPPLGTGFVDVLFSPNGDVISPGVNAQTINLWVRDADKTYPYGGDPTIIAVFTKSGLVASYPVAQNAGNPYLLVR